MNLSEKAQAFEPFKMMIGAIFAMLILVIIIGSVNYFQTLRADISTQRFYDGLGGAVKQPNNQVLLVRDLQFSEGIAFSSNGLGKVVGLDGECIEFVDSGSAFEVTDSVAKTKSALITDVFFRCNVNEGSCEIFCEISFGEMFDE